jgi:hypothetical protein
MGDLEGLEQRIRDRLALIQERRRHVEEQAQEHQSAQEQRADHFRRVADRLLRLHLRPRLAQLAAHFANIVPLEGEEAGRNRCVYVLQQTARFRASGRLELAVHHDLAIEQVFLLYRLDLLPVSFPFEGQDCLVFPLYKIKDERVVAWLDEKLLQVLDVCLRVEAGDLAAEEVVTLRWQSAA